MFTSITGILKVSHISTCTVLFTSLNRICYPPSVQIMLLVVNFVMQEIGGAEGDRRCFAISCRTTGNLQSELPRPIKILIRRFGRGVPNAEI